ncbi:MAG: hypothetical protein RL472_1493, partial [Pseudomonadota bacterium]
RQVLLSRVRTLLRRRAVLAVVGVLALGGSALVFLPLFGAPGFELSLALSMLVIAALVGTRELGQQVFTSLSQGLAGPGIVAGLCVACLALIIDTLLKAAAARAVQRNGVAHD